MDTAPISRRRRRTSKRDVAPIRLGYLDGSSTAQVRVDRYQHAVPEEAPAAPESPPIVPITDLVEPFAEEPVVLTRRRTGTPVYVPAHPAVDPSQPLELDGPVRPRRVSPPPTPTRRTVARLPTPPSVMTRWLQRLVDTVARK